MKVINEFFGEEHIEKLRQQVLFSGLSDYEIFMFVQHARPLYGIIESGDTIHVADAYSHMLGLVLSGSTYVYSIDLKGNRTMLKIVGEGESSGTLYSMLEYHNSLIELEAKQKSEILLVKPESVFIIDEKLAAIQQKILVNLIATQRHNFLDLSEHITCLSRRNIKEKILTLLMLQCEKEHSRSIKIPFSREQMADYLAVDRASLSRSLSELKRDGIIDYSKSEFIVLRKKESVKEDI